MRYIVYHGRLTWCGEWRKFYGKITHRPNFGPFGGTMRTINGQNWLSTFEMASLFDVNLTTILRWCKDDTAAATIGLVIVQDPISQRWYIEEKSAKKLLKKFDIGAPN